MVKNGQRGGGLCFKNLPPPERIPVHTLATLAQFFFDLSVYGSIMKKDTERGHIYVQVVLSIYIKAVYY